MYVCVWKQNNAYTYILYIYIYIYIHIYNVYGFCKYIKLTIKSYEMKFVTLAVYTIIREIVICALYDPKRKTKYCQIF